MKKKVNVTAVSSVILLLVAVVVWFAIPYCIEEYATATDIGPRAFPRLVCGAMAVLCVIQLILLAAGVQKGTCVEFDLWEHLPVFAAMLLALAAVLAALFINILLAGVICGEAFLLLLRAKDWRYYLAVACTGGALFALMKFVMHIRF